MNGEAVNNLFLSLFLRLTERSSYRVMEGKSTFPVCIRGHQFVLPKRKKSSGANDVISMLVYVLSFKCVLCATELQTEKKRLQHLKMKEKRLSVISLSQQELT